MNANPLRPIVNLRQSRRVRKGMFVLPSLFTAGNIGAGYYAIAQCIQAVGGEHIRFDYAAIAIGFAVLFDGLDGRIARLTGSTSEFGKQLDSLADVITFGVAPAILAYMWGFKFTGAPFESGDLRTKLLQFGALLSFLFLVASASRLARFNIQVNPQPSNPGRPGRKYFVGMPTPAGAGVIAAIVHFTSGEPVLDWRLSAIWALLIFSIGYLEVCTWRYYSFKDIDLRRQQPFRNFILLGLLFASIWFFSRPVLFVLALAYMSSGVVLRLIYLVRRPAAPAPVDQAATSR
jgi:CDP-diacylglycerol--serine O-phosphatidyltransferase